MAVSDATRASNTRYWLWLPNDLYDYLYRLAVKRDPEKPQISVVLRELVREHMGMVR